jgi:hypothetical protein
LALRDQREQPALFVRSGQTARHRRNVEFSSADTGQMTDHPNGGAAQAYLVNLIPQATR